MLRAFIDRDDDAGLNARKRAEQKDERGGSK
jgi:hypothetical protein